MRAIWVADLIFDSHSSDSRGSLISVGSLIRDSSSNKELET